MTTQDRPTHHDDRARDELAALAQANLEDRRGWYGPTSTKAPELR
ncbi:MAG: hypothetical protein ACRDRU_21185 [Pseudonocardiaceae bacterium]